MCCNTERYLSRLYSPRECINSVHNYMNHFYTQVCVCTLYVCKYAACIRFAWTTHFEPALVGNPSWIECFADTNTRKSCLHAHTPAPNQFPLPEKLCPKQARRHPLVSPPAHSVLPYSPSPTFSVSACRDLVFLSLSVRSCFYCAIFCHFVQEREAVMQSLPLSVPCCEGE